MERREYIEELVYKLLELSALLTPEELAIVRQTQSLLDFSPRYEFSFGASLCLSIMLDKARGRKGAGLIRSAFRESNKKVSPQKKKGTVAFAAFQRITGMDTKLTGRPVVYELNLN
jgi:hypothetical protein